MPKAEGQAKSTTKKGPSSRNQTIKTGYGSRPNFQLSYGLKMAPEDIAEGNAILEAMEKADKAAGQKK